MHQQVINGGRSFQLSALRPISDVAIVLRKTTASFPAKFRILPAYRSRDSVGNSSVAELHKVSAWFPVSSAYRPIAPFFHAGFRLVADHVSDFFCSPLVADQVAHHVSDKLYIIYKLS